MSTGTSASTPTPRALPELVDLLEADVRRTVREVANELERTVERLRRIADDEHADVFNMPHDVDKALEAGMVNASPSRVGTATAALARAYRTGAIPAQTSAEE